MVIDTSAILAILRDEPERRRFNQAIDVDDPKPNAAAETVDGIDLDGSHRAGVLDEMADMFPPPAKALGELVLGHHHRAPVEAGR